MDMDQFRNSSATKMAAEELAKSNQSIKDVIPPDFKSSNSVFNDHLLNFKPPETRSHQDIRDDYSEKLALISIDDIRKAIQIIGNPDLYLDYHQPDYHENIELIEDCLEKFKRYKSDFEILNDTHDRHIKLKTDELKLEAGADLRDKWRTFYFRALGSFLLIVTLFALGTINHHVSFLHLPFENVIKSNAAAAAINQQAANISAEQLPKVAPVIITQPADAKPEQDIAD